MQPPDVFFASLQDVRLALQVFNDFVDAVQLLRNTYVLRAVRHALATLGAVVGLAVARHGSVEADEVAAAVGTIFGVGFVGLKMSDNGGRN